MWMPLFHHLIYTVAAVFLILRLKRTSAAKNGYCYKIGGAALMGMFVIGIMLNPLDVREGLPFDLRSVPLLLYAFIHGWRRGLLAAALPILYRWDVGGEALVIIVDIGATMLLPTMLGGLACRWNPERGRRLQVVNLKRGLLLTAVYYALNYAAGAAALPLPPSVWGEIASYQLVFGLLSAWIMILILNDDSRLHLSRKQMRRLTRTDTKTDVYNFRYVTEIAERWKTEGRPFRVVLLDIDYFKTYNDAHGHLEGDALLKQLAALLREETRSQEIVARFGGEEFMALLPEGGEKRATALAERIRQATEAYPFPGREVQPGGKVTVSVGVSGEGFELRLLMQEADQALYRSKRNGRNRVTPA
ncbi:diguanylate cyclase [Paenibacillus sp. TRM 82003]|nr:diguanylate cyclase [Paenibacillus sp. TRM 82003]